MQCMLWLDLLWLFFFIVAKVVDSTWYCFWLRLGWGSKWTEPILEGEVKSLVWFHLKCVPLFGCQSIQQEWNKALFCVEEEVAIIWGTENWEKHPLPNMSQVEPNHAVQIRHFCIWSLHCTCTHTQTHSYINGKPTHPSHWMHKLN